MNDLARAVTVVIPTKRDRTEQQEKWLRQAIASIPKGVRYILGENDGELAEAVNAAVDAAETPYVMLMGADDALGTDCLDFLVSLAWDVDVVYPTLIHCSEETMEPFAYSEAVPFCRNRLLVWNYVPGGALFRRHTFLDAGGIDPGFEALEDWECWVRMSRMGARFKHCPEARYLYRNVHNSRNKQWHDKDPATFRAEMTARVVKERPAFKATFIYQASYVTTYYRCLAPASRLPAVCWDFKTWPIVPVDNDGPDVELTEVHGDVVVFQFPGDIARRVCQIALDRKGVATLVETDDTYLDAAPNRTEWGRYWKDAEFSRQGHEEIVRHADGLIVTTPTLAKRYKDVAKQVFICPNQIVPEDWPEPPVIDDGVLRVGWFASVSHKNDAKLVKRALEWCSKQPGVEVVLMGLNPGWKFPYRHIPWTNDFGAYRTLVGPLDIGLAPIVPSPWAVCRSDLKALEYGMASAVPVLSDVAPYQDWKDGVGCRKVASNDAKGFLRVVQELVGNRQLVKDLGAECRAHVLAERTIDQNVWRWQEAIDVVRKR